ncbi:hypothetical protein LCGC14_2214120, partial [marine sediment metagenome]
MIIEKDINKFAKLFRGNIRSYGRWNPDTQTLSTDKGKVPIECFKLHLEGGTGLGIVPITDTDNCYFATIDIDAHNDQEKINLKKIDGLIQKHDLPIIPCRSKSGGVHCYVFCKRKIAASLLVAKLMDWAKIIGHPGSEIFPKQTSLSADQFGNWINLPYHNDGKIRAALWKGKRLNLSEFISVA